MLSSSLCCNESCLHTNVVFLTFMLSFFPLERTRYSNNKTKTTTCTHSSMQVEYDDDNVCMMKGCTQIDLLLGRCGDCNKRYCQTHLAYGAHKCPSHRDAAVLTCPICNRVVPCNPRDDANVIMSQHIDRGCRDLPASHNSHSQHQRLNFCSFHTCKKNELTLIVCDKCGNSYCVDHRMPSRHECKAEANSRTPPRVSPTSRRSPPKNILAPRNSVDAPLGSYHGDEPITVSVLFPTEMGVRPFYFRGGAKVVMGRILDQICTAGDVPNSNNSSLDDQWRVFALRKEGPHGPIPLNSSFASVVSGKSGNGRSSAVLVLCKQDTVPDSVLLHVKAAAGDSTHPAHKDSNGCTSM
jgi:predicted nucleic acid binding AN1-type Zn finger protein